MRNTHKWLFLKEEGEKGYLVYIKDDHVKFFSMKFSPIDKGEDKVEIVSSTNPVNLDTVYCLLSRGVFKSRSEECDIVSHFSNPTKEIM